jgi:hypothetical protein
MYPIFGVGVTQGDSPVERLATAADLLEQWSPTTWPQGWDLPAPSAVAEHPLVRLTPRVAAKAEVYRTMCAASMSKGGCRTASALRCTGTAAFRHSPFVLDKINAALAAVGRRLFVTSEVG